MNRLKKAIEIVRCEWVCPSKSKYNGEVCCEKLHQLFPQDDPSELCRTVREAEQEVISLAE